MSGTAQFDKETSSSGAWERQQSRFRDQVTADGSSGFPATAGRYHLYVSLACPWAHRAVIVRRLKGLEDSIGMTIVDPLRDERGWRFGAGDAITGDRDPLNGWTYLSEAYRATDPSFDGRVTVPTLWDTERGVVVNNESSEVIRMLGSQFNELARSPELDLYPAQHHAEIDSINEWVYETVNNGVYRCGFATKQASYEHAYQALFASLERLDRMLEDRRWIAGSSDPTEADWRLFTTLVRFDAVYVGHFKCNLRTLTSFTHLWPYARNLYQQAGIAETVDLDHIKRHYYMTHGKINPTRIVPFGPAIDWSEPHRRD